MPPSLTSVLCHVRRLVGEGRTADASEKQLLVWFVQHRDESAFATLVRRHGPMVLRVCRRVLGNVDDAEDAFQAAFLVLARRAGDIRNRESVSAFLHGVAYRVALHARSAAARRRVHEQQAQAMRHEAQETEPADLGLRAVLDEEVNRLPEKYRAAVVLCYLQGKTYVEAAAQLGWPEGTVKGRLSRARDLLHRRLTRRGLAPGAAVIVAALAQPADAAVTEALAVATAHAAITFCTGTTGSGTAMMLAEGVLKTMTTTRLLWGALLSIAVITGAGAVVFTPLLARDPAPPAHSGSADPAEKPEGSGEKAADANGDPLPPGAVARLGTVRWRHGARASVLTFAAGGKEVVTAGPDGEVRVWDPSSGKQMRRLGKPMKPDEADAYPRPAALSADGKRAATTGDDGVRVWDVATGKELHRFEHDVEKWAQIVAIALTPDGKGLLISSVGKVVLYDVATGKERQRFEHKNAGKAKDQVEVPLVLGQLTFSPDGKWLAAPAVEAGQPDKDITDGVRIWDVATGKEVLTVGGPVKEDNIVASAAYPAFSPDGKVIARVALDGTIRLHDTAGGKEKRTLGESSKDEVIDGLMFAPGGKTLAALQLDGTIRLYDVATGKELRRLAEGGAKPQTTVSFAPLLRPNEYPSYSADAPPLAFSPDGKTLAVVSGENAVRLWDAATGKELPRPNGHTGGVAELAASADGKTVVTAGTDGTLRRWERATGKQLGEVAAPGDGYSGSLSPTGRFFARVDETTIHVWDVAAKKNVTKLELPEELRGQGQVYVTIFSADEKVLAAADPGGTIHLWDTATGKALRTLTPPQAEGAQTGALLSSLEFSRDGRTLLAVQLMDGAAGIPVPAKAQPAPPQAPPEPKSRICMWDAATGTALRHWDVPGRVMGATFTPDGRSVATATAERVTVWEVATGKERFSDKGAAGLVSCSPDGRVLAAAGGVTGGTAVRVLDLRTGKEIARLKGHDAEVVALAFTHDGSFLVSGSADSTGLVWGGAAMAPPARKPDEQTVERLDELWADLASGDAGKAFRAAALLESSPKGAAALLAERVKPVAAPDAKQVARWIKELDDDSFDVREKAAAELGRLRELARPALEQALKSRSAETQRRAEELLARVKADAAWSSDDLRRLRALEVLEKVNTPEARELLQGLSRGAEGSWLTREAKSSLERQAGRAP
jgi:RNA polymerase sigma factor (sigma-70 family)